MISTLQNQDSALDLINVGAQDIINSLTLDDVKNFLEGLGVEQIEMQPNKGCIICPTICHNPLHSAESMKLYWYQNNKIFRCYTECNEAMSIFKLYQKFVAINEERHPSSEEAIEYVKHSLKHKIQIAEKAKTVDSLVVEKYKYDARPPKLPEYPSSMLSYFTQYHHPLWLKDGITPESMDKFQISFSLSHNQIIIPHFDIDGRLVGIRARSLEKKDIESLGKYRPFQINSTIYTHPLGFNLYGIYEHQEGIRKRRCAIIAEGEKSVLLDDGYYHQFSNTVACCGSQINKYQIHLLTNILGANEITIAFDKEYDDWNSEKAIKYRQKIESMCRHYLAQATFSYIWDYDNLLEEKDSPFDKGKQIFEHLYKNRIRVR